MIPLVDLHAQFKSIEPEINNAIKGCIENGVFVKGKYVEDFEKAFANYLGIEYCLGCGNGTDALEIILAALNIGPGDEVIVPALSWIATAEAVNNAGAEPIFVDIREDTYTIDFRKIEKNITSRTKAIIPVHLYGCPADMNEICEIARKYKLFVIEDCAQAHGAEYFGKKVGTFGIASAFSFFPSKNLGAYGDSGSIVTNNKELFEKARKISNHGQLNIRHEHSVIGRNSRLDAIQASILSVKLPHLDAWNLKRIKVAENYNLKLSCLKDLKLPEMFHDRKHVFHVFVIRCRRRNDLVKLLDKGKIAWSIHYPYPIPFLDAYKYKKHIYTDFPISKKITSEVISLPMFPELTESQIEIITNQIITIY
jgi:dTDP-4-amino-4,6-dideoxygalactose transaminase